MDAGALHFDHHQRVIVQPGAMCLSQRSGGDGLRVEAGEVCVGLVQFGGQHRLDLLKWHGGHFVLQRGQHLDHFGRQDVHARRDKLAELDHHAAHIHGQGVEFARPAAHPGGATGCDGGFTAQPPQHPFPPQHTPEQPRREPQCAPVAAPVQVQGFGWGSHQSIRLRAVVR